MGNHTEDLIDETPCVDTQLFFTIEHTADTLQVSTKTVRRWITAGDLVGHRFGRQWRISNADLHAFTQLMRKG